MDYLQTTPDNTNRDRTITATMAIHTYGTKSQAEQTLARIRREFELLGVNVDYLVTVFD